MSTPAQKPPADQRVAAAQKQNANAQAEQEDDDEEDGISQRFVLFQVMPSWLTSFIFHILIIIILALIPILLQKKKVVDIFSGEARTAVESPNVVEFDSLEDIQQLEAETDQEIIEEKFEENLKDTELTETMEETPLDTVVDQLQPAEIGQAVSEMASAKSDVSSRSKAMRKKMLAANGGTPESENAVKLGLKWIADHQLKDGSWNFDHRKAGPNKTSPNPGRMANASFGATGMALMAFLGAGQTHLEGDYKETVRKGLAYLIKNQQPESNGAGSFRESGGTMYSHGLASIALAEAWSMTRDEKLRVPAQAAINYIVYAQDPAGGGWRYGPRQPGDTSVVGWQVMALKSANMAGLRVPKRTMTGAKRFLDSVQEDSGAYYGYVQPERMRKTMTSVGLLCRMYMGWKHEHPALERGVDYLADRGPAVDKGPRLNWNIYYDYYATQVLKQYGGKKWEAWNKVMREELVKSQSQKGPTNGSWYFTDDGHGSMGGRLYHTCMAVMTLEVYYRYLPLYGKKVQEDEFEF